MKRLISLLIFLLLCGVCFGLSAYNTARLVVDSAKLTTPEMLDITEKDISGDLLDKKTVSYKSKVMTYVKSHAKELTVNTFLQTVKNDYPTKVVELGDSDGEAFVMIWVNREPSIVKDIGL